MHVNNKNFKSLKKLVDSKSDNSKKLAAQGQILSFSYIKKYECIQDNSVPLRTIRSRMDVKSRINLKSLLKYIFSIISSQLYCHLANTA